MAKRVRVLSDDIVVVIEDEFSALSDEEMAQALAAWLGSVREDGDPETDNLAAAAVQAERTDNEP